MTQKQKGIDILIFDDQGLRQKVENDFKKIKELMFKLEAQRHQKYQKNPRREIKRNLNLKLMTPNLDNKSTTDPKMEMPKAVSTGNRI